MLSAAGRLGSRVPPPPPKACVNAASQPARPHRPLRVTSSSPSKVARLAQPPRRLATATAGRTAAATWRRSFGERSGRAGRRPRLGHHARPACQGGGSRRRPARRLWLAEAFCGPRVQRLVERAGGRRSGARLFLCRGLLPVGGAPCSRRCPRRGGSLPPPPRRTPWRLDT